MNLHVDLYETFWWSCTCNKKIARPTPTPRTRTRLANANANGSCNARPGEKTNICCSISTLFLDSHMPPSRQSFKQFNQSPCSTVTVHKFTFTLLRQGTFHCIALSHWLIRYQQKHKCRQFWQFFAQANNYPRNVCSSTGTGSQCHYRYIFSANQTTPNWYYRYQQICRRSFHFNVMVFRVREI